MKKIAKLMIFAGMVSLFACNAAPEKVEETTEPVVTEQPAVDTTAAVADTTAVEVEAAPAQ
ncbi:MAG TPA: hypothetical protein PLC17_05710 [Tenuifilaceae bacterium]|jgi:hypothetical protein|nr:hypothetical protein [Tenuifilaceae bacterium]HPX05412.1 hypothetical protein [Tenuifilaceae bacterium]HQB76837.1 hypothetical protein [Tenuifilaceae bacterium]